ncbi:hypothetical protein BV25DRAFT_1918058 [Artomyces pyxidatus]|uniref:Uncharacterized protein n=1 Tax=Artomyces pyxidatus TaxID=48021 RepID=A0ACB8SUW8_9AGAM|nr:hypothetical protein BV25DRAFT_1918058 [Artomyces pyxidatus]
MSVCKAEEQSRRFVPLQAGVLPIEQSHPPGLVDAATLARPQGLAKASRVQDFVRLYSAHPSEASPIPVDPRWVIGHPRLGEPLYHASSSDTIRRPVEPPARAPNAFEYIQAKLRPDRARAPEPPPAFPMASARSGFYLPRAPVPASDPPHHFLQARDGVAPSSINESPAQGRKLREPDTLARGARNRETIVLAHLRIGFGLRGLRHRR